MPDFLKVGLFDFFVVWIILIAIKSRVGNFLGFSGFFDGFLEGYLLFDVGEELGKLVGPVFFRNSGPSSF